MLGQTRSRRTRQNLIRTAIQLWGRQDFDELSVDAIVAAAGVSKGTFYYHFRRKEDLLLELGWATVDRVGAEAEESYREHRDLHEAIGVAMAGLVRRITAMPRGAVARTIQEFSFRRLVEPSRSDLQSGDSGRHTFLSELLHAAQESGDIPGSVDVDEVADVVNFTVIQTVYRAMTSGIDDDLERTLRRRVGLVLDGMRDTYAPH